MPKTAKRVLVISDLHCGHVVGLTPPSAQDRAGKKVNLIQKELWGNFEKPVKELGKVDVLIINGDCIDGAGKKSGGTEQTTTDRLGQVELAYECIETVDADKVFMTFGTGYHTGMCEDWELVLAKLLHLGPDKILSHPQIDVNGFVFDVKHHLGSSSVPHGRHTASAKERLWNLLWADAGVVAKANVIIRSHVHYHQFCGGHDWLAMTTPALQGMGSKFGERRCSGLVHHGVVHFDIDGKGGLSEWHSHIKTIRSQVQKPLIA